MPYSTNKSKEIVDLANKIGVEAASEKLGLAISTITREIRRWEVPTPEKTALSVAIENQKAAKFLSKFTEEEIYNILKSAHNAPRNKRKAIHDFEGTRVRIGVLSDLHLGSIYTDPSRIAEAFRMFRRKKVDFVVISGDITEGMSNRPGHVYELSHVGYRAQKDHAIEVLSQWKKKMYLIDGNHDRWFIKSNGAVIVEDIARQLPDAEFLGHDEGDITIGHGTILRLWHGEDSSSYAISYRLQKIVESFQGGEKPNFLITGHTHKYGNFFIRNVHILSAGCIQSQSKWMRGKRIEAHPCFNITELVLNESGIGHVTNTLYPFYC